MEFKQTKKWYKERIDELVEIKNTKGLTAENLVKQAKNKNSHLHDLFNWNIKEAAELHWLQKARELINEVKIIIDDKEYYAFESISIQVEDSDIKTREYYTHNEIIEDFALRKAVIQKALESLVYWKNKYNHYSEFSGVVKEINKVERFMSQQKNKAR